MFNIRESVRAKQLRVTVYPNGEVWVTKPRGIASITVTQFLAKHGEWIKAQQTRAQREEKRYGPRVLLPKPRRGSREYLEAQKAARVLVHVRLKDLNQEYGHAYGSISIRNQKTRWGSCSAKGNLSFNYRIIYLPKELQDYILVHELCHVKEHNHSKRFWDLVARTVPNHKQLRLELHRRYRY